MKEPGGHRRLGLWLALVCTAAASGAPSTFRAPFASLGHVVAALASEAPRVMAAPTGTPNSLEALNALLAGRQVDHATLRSAWATASGTLFVDTGQGWGFFQRRSPYRRSVRVPEQPVWLMAALRVGLSLSRHQIDAMYAAGGLLDADLTPEQRMEFDAIRANLPVADRQRGPGWRWQFGAGAGWRLSNGGNDDRGGWLIAYDLGRGFQLAHQPALDGMAMPEFSPPMVGAPRLRAYQGADLQSLDTDPQLMVEVPPKASWRLGEFWSWCHGQVPFAASMDEELLDQELVVAPGRQPFLYLLHAAALTQGAFLDSAEDGSPAVFAATPSSQREIRLRAEELVVRLARLPIPTSIRYDMTLGLGGITGQRLVWAEAPEAVRRWALSMLGGAATTHSTARSGGQRWTHGVYGHTVWLSGFSAEAHERYRCVLYEDTGGLYGPERSEDAQ